MFVYETKRKCPMHFNEKKNCNEVCNMPFFVKIKMFGEATHFISEYIFVIIYRKL